MKRVRVLVLVAMGVSAFCGFAQDGAPGAGAAGRWRGGAESDEGRSGKAGDRSSGQVSVRGDSECPGARSGRGHSVGCRERRTWGQGSSWVGAIEGCGAVGDGARGRCAFSEALERAEQSSSWAGRASGLHLWGWATDVGCYTASREFDRVASGRKNPGRASDWRLGAMGGDADLVGVRGRRYADSGCEAEDDRASTRP